MAAAEQRYREALVKIGNADPSGTAESDAALEDMEDVIAACMKQKGCSVPTMLAAYKRLLKLQRRRRGRSASTRTTPTTTATTTPSPRSPPTCPEAARAAHLLADDHRFDKMVQYNPAGAGRHPPLAHRHARRR